MKTGRLFITGDIHGSSTIGKLSSDNFPESKNLSKKDIVIIAGDCGLLWSHLRTKEEEHWIKWLDTRPFTTCFVDGNHENFDILKTLPRKELFGSQVGIVSHSIFHLLRGEVYRINQNKVLTIGGAHSHDRQYRNWGTSMWREEEITEIDISKAKENIEKVFFDVDIVVSHCAPPDFAIKAMPVYLMPHYTPDHSEEWLGILKDHSGLTYKHWYFGHYHTDITDPIHCKWTCLYDKIVEIIKT
jgi:predicted phosphohydrolase